MKNEPSFTPGPWVIKNCWRTGMALIQDTRGEDIAICDEGFPQLNARLIAAAPDLLEACEQALAGVPTDHGAFQTLRAAIEKARGN